MHAELLNRKRRTTRLELTNRYGRAMGILIAFIIAALIFGVGGVIRGLAWAIVIGIALAAIAALWAYRTLTSSRQ